MAHESPSSLKERHLVGSASGHHVQYTGHYLFKRLRHGAILDNVAIEWIVMAFSIVNSAGYSWTDGIRRVLVWVSESVYFHVAVVSIQCLVSLGLQIKIRVSEAFDIDAYPKAKTSPLPLIARPTQSLILRPMCLLRSRISVVPMDPAPRKTAFFACTHIKSP